MVDHVDVLHRTHQVHGRDVAEDVGEADHGVLDRLALVVRFQPFGQRPPGGGGLHFQFRQRHRAPAEVFMGVKAYLFEQRDDGTDQHLAARARQGAGGHAVELVEHLQAGGEVGVGVVADVDAAHVGLLVVEIQLFHLILVALVHVDGVLMEQHRHGEAIHLADDAVLLGVGDIDDEEVLVAGRAQIDARLRKFLRHPVIAAGHMAEDGLIAEVVQKLRRVVDAVEQFAVLKGQFVGGALDVVEENVQIVRVDERPLGRLAEEVVRVVDDVLVEGAGRGHEDHQALAAPPPGAPGLLPCAGDGTRVAAEHAGVELADVNAQFQRVGGNDGKDIAGAQFALDLAPLRRQVAAAIAAHAAGVAERIAHHVLQIAHQHLHGEAGAGKDDGLHPGAQKPGGDVARFRDGAGADAELAVDDGRIVKDHVALARGRAVFVDEAHGAADHRFGEFAGVGDGGRAADKRGMGAVEGADAL